MDNRRIDSLGLIAAGILDLPIPKVDIPRDREELDVDVQPIGDPMPVASDLVEALNSGKVLVCREYYGIPNAWKDGDKYRGCLLQYRQVTESPTFDTAEECAEWFLDRAYACVG